MLNPGVAKMRSMHFRLLKEERFDLIFLDIEMPLLTGLDLLGTLKDPPPVIITTAYRDYAVESFEFEALDYLVKPISFPRFVKAFERAMKPVVGGENALENNQRDEFLFLKVERKLVKIMISDILYIESLKDYIPGYNKNRFSYLLPNARLYYRKTTRQTGSCGSIVHLLSGWIK